MADGGLDYGPQALVNTTSHSRAAHGCVFNFVICACCLLFTWYLSGLCAHESLGQKTDTILPVRTDKMSPPVLKPGKYSYPLLPEEELERLPRAPHCTDRARASTNASGRASRVDYLACREKVLVRRDAG